MVIFLVVVLEVTGLMFAVPTCSFFSLSLLSALLVFVVDGSISNFSVLLFTISFFNATFSLLVVGTVSLFFIWSSLMAFSFGADLRLSSIENVSIITGMLLPLSFFSSGLMVGFRGLITFSSFFKSVDWLILSRSMALTLSFSSKMLSFSNIGELLNDFIVAFLSLVLILIFNSGIAFSIFSILGGVVFTCLGNCSFDDLGNWYNLCCGIEVGCSAVSSLFWVSFSVFVLACTGVGFSFGSCTTSFALCISCGFDITSASFLAFSASTCSLNLILAFSACCCSCSLVNKIGVFISVFWVFTALLVLTGVLTFEGATVAGVVTGTVVDTVVGVICKGEVSVTFGVVWTGDVGLITSGTSSMALVR